MIKQEFDQLLALFRTRAAKAPEVTAALCVEEGFCYDAEGRPVKPREVFAQAMRGAEKGNVGVAFTVGGDLYLRYVAFNKAYWPEHDCPRCQERHLLDEAEGYEALVLEIRRNHLRVAAAGARDAG